MTLQFVQVKVPCDPKSNSDFSMILLQSFFFRAGYDVNRMYCIKTVLYDTARESCIGRINMTPI